MRGVPGWALGPVLPAQPQRGQRLHRLGMGPRALVTTLARIDAGIMGLLSTDAPERLASRPGGRPGRKRRPSRAALVVGAALLAAVAVGLAVAGLLLLRGSPYDRILAAAERTEDAGSARVSITTVADGGVGQTKQRIDTDGLLDFRTGAAELEIRVGPAVTGGTVEPGQFPMILTDDGTDSFVRFPNWAPDQPSIRLDPDSDGGADGGTGLGSDGLGTTLAALAGGVTDVRSLGDGDVRGDETTRYRVETDLRRAADQATGESGEGLSALADQVGDTLEMDIWVDDDHIRRLSYTLDLTGSATLPDDVPSADPSADPSDDTSLPDVALAPAPGATLQVVVEYFDFGVPFTVRPPANAVDQSGEPVR